MKITRKQLGRIIQEELDTLKEGGPSGMTYKTPPTKLSPQMKRNIDLATQHFENLKRFYAGEVSLGELFGDLQSRRELIAFLEGNVKFLRDPADRSGRGFDFMKSAVKE
jgi:hypothetical protein